MAYTINSQVFGEGDYQGMPDVIVTEVGTPKSAKTDSQGKFTFSATSANSMIRFQMLGYKEKVIKASEAVGFVNLESEAYDMDEVTIFGGKKDNTLLILAICATTVIVTAAIISKNRNKPQKVQLK